jgi:catechol 2,3-dioxygenase-like lactoylglutathione lyase family enzyme
MPEVTGSRRNVLVRGRPGARRTLLRRRLRIQELIGDERFCALSVADRNVLLLFRKGQRWNPFRRPVARFRRTMAREQLHVAFAIPAAAEADWQRRLAERGIAIESTVDWPRGGRSLYFRDPDQHLLELITPGCWSIY